MRQQKKKNQQGDKQKSTKHYIENIIYITHALLPFS